MTNPEFLGLLLALVGCFVGLTGWLSGREKKISNDGEWRGTVNTKLDAILGLNQEISCLDTTVKTHGERLSAVESSVKSAHHRLDKGGL